MVVSMAGLLAEMLVVSTADVMAASMVVLRAAQSAA
jgi:hypothetical protein